MRDSKPEPDSEDEHEHARIRSIEEDQKHEEARRADRLELAAERNVMSVRILAWQLLRDSQTPLREIEHAAQEAQLDARDRGLLRKLVATEIRRRGSLRAIVRSYATGKPNSDLCAHLHLGLVQLLFLDQIPDHAAVSETVGATHRTLGPSKVKYVNAVLRAVTRDRKKGANGNPRRDLIGRDLHLDKDVFRDRVEHPLLWAEDALSIPAPIYKRWLKHHGEEKAEALARLALEESPLSVRVVQGERDAHLEQFHALDIEGHAGKHEKLILFSPSATSAVINSPAFASGQLTVQGETAVRAVELVDAKDKERILDLCAAPGGKTAVLAASGASVLACDLDESRLERIRESLTRFSLLERVELLASDGTQAVTESDFDAVLLDAPCSNTGVLAARPSARWRYGPETKRSLIALQDRLLDEAAAKVRAGGCLVYSTCSLESDENSGRIKSFLERNPKFRLEEEHLHLPNSMAWGGPVDGGYSARLTR